MNKVRMMMMMCLFCSEGVTECHNTPGWFGQTDWKICNGLTCSGGRRSYLES